MASPFAITFFDDYAAATKREVRLTLAELADMIRSTTASSKQALPWLKMATFGDRKTDKECLRHDLNMIVIIGVEGDCDLETVSFDEAVEIAEKIGLCALIYTSPSHTPDKPRWRILALLSREHPPAARTRLMARLNGLYGGIFSIESWTLSQSYYFGSVANNPDHRVEVVEGQPLDELDELDEIAIGKPSGGSAGQPRKAKKPNGNAGHGDGIFPFFAHPVFDETAIAADIVSGNRYHTACVQLAGRWAHDGVPFADALHRLRGIFEEVPADRRDARWRMRYDDIGRCTRDIYHKEARKADEAVAQPVEPTYPAPPEDITLDATRKTLAAAMRDINAKSLAYIESAAASRAEAKKRDELATYRAPPPPVIGINADVGIGKTWAWCREVARPHIERGLHPVLAVPRHKLAGEIVADFAAMGVAARDFRGRGYPDPAQPGKNMCHEPERIKAIEEGGIGNIARQACRDITGKCRSCELCGYEKQPLERPALWLLPHQMLTREKPAFIECDVLGIDESFWPVLLNGVEHRITLELNSLITGDRVVPFDPDGTADLMEVSRKAHGLLMAGPDGRLRRAELTAALHAARISVEALRTAGQREASRRIDPGVSPGMPVERVKERCGRVAAHNAEAAMLARFWELLADTVTGTTELSPWLDLTHRAKNTAQPEIHLAWCDEIHESWRGVPTVIMDATMPVAVVQRFFPAMAAPVQITAATPHARITQITDVPMSKHRLIPTDAETRENATRRATDADTRENKPRRANIERVRRFIEYEAFLAGPGKVAVICNFALEKLLLAGPGLPGNVMIDHYNNVSGSNAFADVAVLILVGRPEAPALVVEQIARVLHGCDIAAIPPDAAGRVNYPLVTRGLRTRDGTIAVNGPQHPDPRAELIRWVICEGQLIQSSGRPRPASRTAETPVRIIALTNVVLPFVVDEVTTWAAIQPSEQDIMRSRGAVPSTHADQFACYPDLFKNAKAAEDAARRDRRNPPKTPIEESYIGKFGGFLSVAYRKRGSRGPAGRLLFDPARIDPAAWLAAKLGVEVTLLDTPRPIEDTAAPEPEVEPRQPIEDTAAPEPEPEAPAARDDVVTVVPFWRDPTRPKSAPVAGVPPWRQQKSDPPASAPAPETIASVPFMITNRMRADLAARGHTADEIRQMTPADAHAVLSQPAGEKRTVPWWRDPTRPKSAPVPGVPPWRRAPAYPPNPVVDAAAGD